MPFPACLRTSVDVLFAGVSKSIERKPVPSSIVSSLPSNAFGESYGHQVHCEMQDLIARSGASAENPLVYWSSAFYH